MLEALAVAKYILKVGCEECISITNLRLQSLLYLIQADYLVENKGEPLFSDHIEAWECGPVIREIFEKYERFGNNPITEVSYSDDLNLTEYHKKFIDGALELCVNYSTSELVNGIRIEEPYASLYKENKYS